MGTMECCISDQQRIAELEQKLREEQEDTQEIEAQCGKLKQEIEILNGKAIQADSLRQEKKQIFREMMKKKKKATELELTAKDYKAQLEEMEKEYEDLQKEEED
eukprot:287026_1